jgi:hypothetical protein
MLTAGRGFGAGFGLVAIFATFCGFESLGFDGCGFAACCFAVRDQEAGG